MPSEHQAAWCVGGLFTAVFGFQVGNQAVDAFGFDGFAELVAVYGNQACAFYCDIVCAVFAAALVSGEVHVDRFLAGNVDFGADNDFFTAFVYDRVVFDVDLGVF